MTEYAVFKCYKCNETIGAHQKEPCIFKRPSKCVTTQGRTWSLTGCPLGGKARFKYVGEDVSDE